MVICPDCGKDVPESKFCKNCGAYIKDVKSPAEPSDKFGFCSNCGHELDGEYSFCPECGADISSKDEVNATDVTETEESPIEEEVDEKEEEVEESPIEEEVDEKEEEVEESPIEDVVSSESGDVEDVDSVEEIEDEVSSESVEQEETESLPATVQSSDNVSFCFNCGYKLVGDYKFCPDCGQDLSGKAMGSNTQTANSHSTEKSTLLAVILSLFLPGLGQIYLGLDHKGAIFLIAYVISAILILILIGFLLCLVIWIWALVDTIISANAINRGEEVQDKLL